MLQRGGRLAARGTARMRQAGMRAGEGLPARTKERVSAAAVPRVKEQTCEKVGTARRDALVGAEVHAGAPRAVGGMVQGWAGSMMVYGPGMRREQESVAARAGTCGNKVGHEMGAQADGRVPACLGERGSMEAEAATCAGEEAWKQSTAGGGRVPVFVEKEAATPMSGGEYHASRVRWRAGACRHARKGTRQERSVGRGGGTRRAGGCARPSRRATQKRCKGRERQRRRCVHKRRGTWTGRGGWQRKEQRGERRWRDGLGE